MPGCRESENTQNNKDNLLVEEYLVDMKKSEAMISTGAFMVTGFTLQKVKFSCSTNHSVSMVRKTSRSPSSLYDDDDDHRRCHLTCAPPLPPSSPSPSQRYHEHPLLLFNIICIAISMLIFVTMFISTAVAFDPSSRT